MFVEQLTTLSNFHLIARQSSTFNDSNEMYAKLCDSQIGFQVEDACIDAEE